ncbi:arginase family protein [Phnomibacter ginsenosidimutans]|uniref:Agmatinase n=1 Tax=Phnomibacter ginsenosidimutans TaxID=2676868 RepID=A0A6I6G7V6_9BACT|nr:arginase family protein [Phnomibacter ginsenosidimutans]QGW28477.1 agmatinase [Phnomibacter ginsenosidimutans]
MADLSNFDVNCAGNPNNNIFGLPFTEDESRLVIVPVPWEVTVSFGAGTARAAEQVFKASLQVDIFDQDSPEAWKQGFYMRPIDRKVLLKSDFLRKEAELFIDFISRGEDIKANRFMCKSIRDINEGSDFLNNWVYEQTSDLLKAGKMVGLLGGDHSTSLGYWKAQAERHESFGILQIDAHCDLRPSYEFFKYSHASVVYNGLEEIPQLSKVVQMGVRDFSQGEWEYLQEHKDRITCFFDRDLKNRRFEGATWQQLCDDIIAQLPQKVHLSFDIDGLNPKLCPRTGTPVDGGFETEEINYLLRKLLASGRELIGFDLVEIGIGESGWDANVGARQLWKLCNMMVSQQQA